MCVPLTSTCAHDNCILNTFSIMGLEPGSRDTLYSRVHQSGSSINIDLQINKHLSGIIVS